NTGHTRTESTPAFSPAYAAPEQVAFSRTGPWTDVHALGLILTEVMTDEPPFSDADPEAHLFEQVMASRRPTPASKGKDVGPFEPIIAKALALSPRDRWRNASDLLAALEEAKAGRAMLSPNVSTASSPHPAPLVETTRPGPRPRVGIWQAARLAVALGALAIVLAGAAWIVSTRRQTVAPPPEGPGPGSAAAVAAAVAGPERNPESAPGPAIVPDVSAVVPPASWSALLPRPGPPRPAIKETAAWEASAPKKHGKEKKRVPTAPDLPKKVEDGRDLFNDTK
ncbi:MAG TPA: hypothetical protein VKO16_08510, partial [Polyangia bacterium]|nr:hypothetical protein [Polyangia bacterium]